jgi:CheY-like chemotaxis protein
VVLDFRLPGMSGLEMVNRLRKHKPGTKIILVTGVEDVTTRQHIAQADVAAYFFKPIDIATFLDAVRHCLWPDLEQASQSEVRGIVSEAQGISKPPTTAPGISAEPSTSRGPGEREVKPIASTGYRSPIDERLTALRGQVRAVSVLLVNEIGQVVEVAGNPSPITSGSLLLPALMDAFRASQKVSNALGKGSKESLLYFTDVKQRIYLAPVDPSNALLLVIVEQFEPDKLGLLDRAIHLAVQDLRDILERMQEVDSLQTAAIKVEQAELPAEINVDPETLARVTDMFSQAKKGGGKQEADGFWETLGENGGLDDTRSKGVLSYDQARDMGLAPDDDQQS